MKHKSTRLLRSVLLIVALIGFGLLHSFGQDYRGGVLQGTIRIKLKPTLASAIKISKSPATGAVTTGIQELDRLNKTYSVTEMKRVFRYSPKFEEKHKQYGLNLWYEVTIGTRASSTEAVKGYSQLQEVDKAEPILQATLVDGASKPVYLSKGERGSTTEYFNDPYLYKQWHYNNTGQTAGKPGCDINAYKAWDITKGSKNVIVSIHDEGVDVKHEDLKDAMWINEAELNGVAGVDDDGNGYKDDVYGFNFGNNMGAIDAMPHGTHVSGTVGAVNNNGIGVSGVAGGSGSADGARIMSCQILGGAGFGNTPDSYVYAADNGAVISQNSWGYTTPGAFEQSVLDAIDYFIAEAGSYPGSPMKGGIVIFAAGNSSTESPNYPGYYSSCVAVSALNASSHATVYSNYGTWVDISAPGGQAEDNSKLDPKSEFKNSVLSTLNNDSYGYMDGTSMACPHVSGIAALVVSKFGGASFTNSDLKNRLLTGTRFLDTIPANSFYVGKLGSGSADAVLALANNAGIAPLKITDLQLGGIAQDFATIKWSVPSDVDDKKPVSFEIIYSTSEISATNLSLAKTILLNSRLEPGEKDSLEITYLKSLTKYYFAVRAVDRWGNKSELSNIAVGTTNAGPDAKIDPSVTALDFTIDVSANAVGSKSFNLLNTGEGLLKWDALTRHKSAYPNSLASVKYPEIQASHYSNGRKLLSSAASEFGVPEALAIDKPTSEYINYVAGWSLWVIGESDTTYTNSSATRFRVTNTKGFNLTNIEAFLVHKEATGPIILEIYEGENIADAKVVYKQEIFNSSSTGYTPIALSERIYFEKGKVFWIVFHVPSMNRYPLGAGLEQNKEDSKNCYFSSDLGKTWGMFEDVYYDNQLVWAVSAKSMFEYNGEYITLTPETGTVEANSSLGISASVDGSKMVNGTYSSNIIINTNETSEPMLRLPSTIIVKGHKPIIVSEKRVDVGGVLIGNDKVIEVKLQNEGLGRFQFSNFGYDSNGPVYFKSSDPQFSYVSGLSSYFEARTQQTIKFRFKPTASGYLSATIQMKDNKGNTHSFELYGVGLEPPVLELMPSDTTITGKSIGDEVTGSFMLKNAGKFPLDYFFPVFADGTNMNEQPKNVHKFGYLSSVNASNFNPSPAYAWTDISSIGTDITRSLASAPDPFYQVDLGFSFPFFGKNESSVYVSRYSTLSFDTEGSIWSTMPLNFQWEGLPDRIISVLGIETIMGSKGRVYFKRYSNRAIVQWENVSLNGLGEATYQVVLHENGNINIYIKDIIVDQYSTVSDLGYNLYVGIEDQTKSDGLLVSDNDSQNIDIFTAESSIEFINPGLGLFTSLTNPFGTIQPGGTARLSYTVKTNTLNVDSYLEKLAVISNDPVHKLGLYSATINVTAGGVPNVVLSGKSLDFGKVFQNDEKVESIFIADTGRASVTIESATFKHGYFTIDGSFPEILKAKQSNFYNVALLTTTVGVYNDTLVFTTNEGKTYEMAFAGEVIDAPAIATNIAAITETIVSGNSKVVSLVVSNTGNSDMDIAPVGNGWMTIAEKATRQVPSIPANTYHFKSSKDVGGPEFSWVDITSTGTKVTVGDPWMGEVAWSSKINLPFNFNFYGVDYSYIYVGYNGIISFTEGQELNPFGTGQPIPNKDVPNNFIAPLFGFVGPSDPTMYPSTGYYCKVEDDRVIVEFCDFNNAFGMTEPISIEAILYKNGNIKYQYKLKNSNEPDVITRYGSIGVENIDGSEGVQVEFYNSSDKHEMAYELYPANKYTIAAKSSKEFEVTFNAKELFAGDYAADLVLINNAPSGQGTSIPVMVTVTGNPDIKAPSSVELSDMLAIEESDYFGSSFKTYEKEFEVENVGTAKSEILQFDVSKIVSSSVLVSTKAQDWFGNWVEQWVSAAELPGFDWNTGMPIPLFFQPKQAMKYKVTITPEMAQIVKDTLVIVTDSGNILIPINGEVFTAPVIATNPDTLKVYAQVATHTETKAVLFDNTVGGYDLRYSLAIDYKRPVNASAMAVEPEVSSVSGNLTLAAQKLDSRNKHSETDSRAYNRQLSYEAATSAESGVGYGGSSAFLHLNCL